MKLILSCNFPAGWLTGLIYKSMTHYRHLVPLFFLFPFQHHTIFFKFIVFKDLIIFRQRGREGERERNMNVWLPLTHPLLRA